MSSLSVSAVLLWLDSLCGEEISSQISWQSKVVRRIKEHSTKETICSIDAPDEGVGRDALTACLRAACGVNGKALSCEDFSFLLSAYAKECRFD